MSYEALKKKNSELSFQLLKLLHDCEDHALSLLLYFVSSTLHLWSRSFHCSDLFYFLTLFLFSSQLC